VLVEIRELKFINKISNKAFLATPLR